MSPTTDPMLREQRGAILVVTINRPDARNALDAAVVEGLSEAVRSAESDPGVSAIVLTASGDRAFCAGVDLQALADGAGSRTAPEEFLRLMSGDVTVPVIAAVNGKAVGAGCELVFGADVVVAVPAASFGLPEVKRGMIAGIGVVHASRRLPLGIALELALTGDPLSAERAHAFGLVNQIVPAESLMEAALAIAGRIGANAPLSLTGTKEILRASAAGAPGVPERLAAWQKRIFTSEDAREGATAFMQKRAPEWRGR